MFKRRNIALIWISGSSAGPFKSGLCCRMPKAAADFTKWNYTEAWEKQYYEFF